MDTSQSFVKLEKVATNNLKDIDVQIPLKKFTVVTGVSGSGKSSLVFDTLYGESYRRYVESLSSYARQYLKALPRPKVFSVKNLPPAIAVKQTRSGTTNRSTVGTLTELTDLLRIVFAHLSEVICFKCGRVVEKDNADTTARKMKNLHNGERVLLTAPLAEWSGMKPKDLAEQLSSQGFTRVVYKNSVEKLDNFKVAQLPESYVVIDRVEITDSNRSRLLESLALAFRVGRGRVSFFKDPTKELTSKLEEFSGSMECCGVSYLEPSIELFSFNHPLGACTNCQGFGHASVLDWEKIIPDHSASLATKGIACWNFGQHAEMYTYALKDATRIKKDIKSKAFEKYSESDWEWLRKGSNKDFDGIEGYFKWLDSHRYKPHYRIHSYRFRKYIICPTCNGDRLRDVALACKIQGLNISEVCRLSIKELEKWTKQLGAEKRESRSTDDSLMGLQEAIDDTKARTNYLMRMGLSYLSLSRTARTLSGGELQRIYMSRCLGSSLTETLYCLDEPTSGLHARDSKNILEVICELRDQGNTIVAVEHERTLIRGADHILEIGPHAGHKGGHVVYDGPPRTAKEKSFAPQANVRKLEKFLEINNASTNNLKNVSARIPIAAVTSICGVSGSGKTSLIQHTFYPAVSEILGNKIELLSGQAIPKFKSIQPTNLVKAHSEIMLVSQAPIGRSTRSNIATYLGIFDEIRKLFANTEQAKASKLTPGDFSFNTPGGRCETCRGLGTVTEDLSFLGEMNVICPTCEGRRFEEKVLDCKYKAKNLLEVLALTVDEAREFFYDSKNIVRALETVIDLGLSYLTLGQNTSSFSGGEAQRLKMVELLQAAKAAKPSILIFDEPTTGLSDADVRSLITQLHRLADRGHTVLVVEHHLDVIKTSDWVIEIGPEAAELGGNLVYEGLPAGLAKVKESRTAPYLN